MIVAGSASPLLLSSAGGYNLTKSLRFRSSASAYLNRTMTTATNNLKWTWSAWVKRGKLADTNIVFGAGDGTSDNFGAMQFTSGDVIQYSQINSSSYVVRVSTNAVFRDPSAWYHVVLVYDSANATSTDRVQIYVNGTRQSVTYTTGPFAQNTSSQINSALAHYISKLDYASLYFDGYLAEVNFIDGQALTPSSFGQTSSTTGVWIPKKYTGTYGTNGFYLPFTDTTSTSTLGTDFSGNSNTWTVNNISLTSGSTYDSMTDVPTLTSATTANYAVMNPLDKGTSVTISEGNLSPSIGSAAWQTARATIAFPTTGKWYVEATSNQGGGSDMVGIGTAQAGLNNYAGADAYGWSYNAGNGYKYNNGSGSAYGATYTTGDVIGVAFDADAGTLTFYKNNVSQGTAFSSLTGGPYYLMPSVNNNNWYINFGQRPFAYTPPTGFKALNTFNLPTPTIGATASTQANKYMDATLYTGNGSTQSITNAGGFQPDLVWYKGRSTAYNHRLFDVIRGVTKDLQSNSTDAEGTISGLTAFNSNGFSLGSEVGGNNNGTTYVAWQWRASNATAVTNTAGSITSTVSANTTAGFSIATYTGNGSTGATIGHGLGVTPSMVIVKKRSSTGNWITYHTSTGINQYLYLNSTAAAATASPTWGVSSTTVTFQQAFSDYNDSGVTYVAYCFAQIAGYSAFGSYTGNGSSDGTFVFTGFRPKFLIVKRTNDIGSWIMTDSARSTYNVTGELFNANTSGAEFTTSDIKFDYLSNGFKLREVNGAINASGSTYIYMAFAESPFKYANAR